MIWNLAVSQEIRAEPPTAKFGGLERPEKPLTV
jgi:hypothetical protein